jgi:hypothetical protein
MRLILDGHAAEGQFRVRVECWKAMGGERPWSREMGGAISLLLLDN